MRTRHLATTLLAIVASFAMLHAFAGTGVGMGSGGSTAVRPSNMFEPGNAPLEPVPQMMPRDKTVANGLYMSGQFHYVLSGGTASITLDQINNDSFTRTTGTLRLELWATTSYPARADTNWTGYRMATFSTFDQLVPRAYYTSISRSSTYAAPPTGTYWLILLLEEYNPSANCSSEGYCTQDSFNSFEQVSFGSVQPTFNYTDLWWNASESGWGVSITHHSSNIAFVAWYTYDNYGIPYWYVASNCTFVGDTCTGTLYETTGPAFGPTFNPSQVTVNTAGSVTLTFTAQGRGTMRYTARGITVSKSITRQPF